MCAPDTNRKVYIVDDDEAVAHALQFALELEGFDIETFSSGEELLERPTLSSKGCLVLDYNLPGKNGLDTIDELRARGVELPAILITSLPSLTLSWRATTSGVVIVKKPLLSDELVLALKTALSG